MGFLARVHAPESRSHWTGPLSMSDHDIIKRLNPHAKTIAGVPVNEQTAYTFSAVYDAVNQLSSDLAKVPLVHKKRLATGGSDDFTTSKLYKLLKYAPNPEQNPFVFRRTLVAYALTWHGSFAEIVRNGLNEPTALNILEPWRVRTTRERGRLEYRVTNYTAADTFLAPRDVLHLQGLGNGFDAYPLIRLASQAIGLALAAEAFGATFFGNGLQFGGILTSEQPWDEEEAARAKAVLEQMYVGPTAAHQLVALWGGLKLQMTGVDPQKAEMNDLRNQQIQEVARFFNMPLHKLKLAIPGAVSYASVEMADLDYYKGPILTWGKQIEDECNLKLIPPLEQSQQFVKHNFNAFLRGDIKSRYEALGIARDKGIINADEWRDLEDMNPQDGGQGQLYLVQSAQVPVNLLSQLVESQIKKNEAPKPTPAAPNAPNDEAVRALAERLARAEAAVDEQREIAKATTERAHQAALDLAASQTERDALKVAAEKAQEITGHLEAIQAGIATDLAQAREALARETEARTALQADATVAARDAAALINTRTEERDAALKVGADATAKITVLETKVGEIAAARDALDLKATEIAKTVTELEQARDAALAAVKESRTAAESSAAIESQLTEARAAATAAEAAIQARQTELDAAKKELTQARESLQQATTDGETATREIERLTAELKTAETRATEAETARDTANQAQQAAKDLETAREQAVGAALRGVIVKEFARRIWRECDRMKRAHATAPKLRTAIGLFYDAHRSETAEALVTPITGYLAWLRLDVPAGEIADAIAAEYVTGSKRDLDAVLATDPLEDLPAVLDQCLQRWERDRPEALTDQILRLAQARGAA